MARKQGSFKRTIVKSLVSAVPAIHDVPVPELVLVRERITAGLGEPEARVPKQKAIRSLLAERRRLQNELRHQELVEQEHPTTGNHMADDASEVSEQAKTLALRRHLEGMLAEIERALVRAERGTYGRCEQCGRSISQERLQVMPSAFLCIDCAKLHAHNHK